MIYRFTKSIYRNLLNEYLKIKHRGKNIRFLNSVTINNKTVIEGYNSFGENNSIISCKIGLGSYTGKNVSLNSVVIGRFCSIGSNVKNIFGNHPIEKFVSTHPAFFSTNRAAGFTFSEKDTFKEIEYLYESILVEIGNDVWIGEGVSILGNVRIGDGAIIGANSLVTRDVEPYSINYGCPSKKVKSRFDNETISFLLKKQWWTKDITWLNKNYKAFADIGKLKELI